jgi:hypothetical protein
LTASRYDIWPHLNACALWGRGHSPSKHGGRRVFRTQKGEEAGRRLRRHQRGPHTCGPAEGQERRQTGSTCPCQCVCWRVSRDVVLKRQACSLATPSGVPCVIAVSSKNTRRRRRRCNRMMTMKRRTRRGRKCGWRPEVETPGQCLWSKGNNETLMCLDQDHTSSYRSKFVPSLCQTMKTVYHT